MLISSDLEKDEHYDTYYGAGWQGPGGMTHVTASDEKEVATSFFQFNKFNHRSSWGAPISTMELRHLQYKDRVMPGQVRQPRNDEVITMHRKNQAPPDPPGMSQPAPPPLSAPPLPTMMSQTQGYEPPHANEYYVQQQRLLQQQEAEREASNPVHANIPVNDDAHQKTLASRPVNSIASVSVAEGGASN